MNKQIDAKAAAMELTAYLTEVMHPPAEGASLGAILGAYTFKGVLREAGYVIVPLTPTPDMVSAFRRGLFRIFSDRYNAMIAAAWHERYARDV